ncbi:autotransporter outer membrane beta-barrel domain-containing protein [Thalassospira lucentensis]|uniref:autotransporter outer membrane beta-barrel domain-containing protein n=1 Tax=Thalassospira lucentensis TaxID=168935 RepID=UPI00399D5A11
MYKNRSTFKQERSDRSPVTTCKSFFKKGLYALALTGLSLPFANSAFALSNGCNTLNSFSGTSNGAQFSSAFSANEIAKITFTHAAPASTINYTFTYTDNNNAANSQTITTGSSENGDTITLSFEIPADTTNGVLRFEGVGATYNMTGACALKATPSSTSSTSTSSAVVNAVSRSQTTVIQQNIGARIASANGNSTNTGLGNSGLGAPGTTETENTNLVDMSPKNRTNSITNRDDALRRMAMMGSFDSSTGLGMDMLGLGPTDQGDVGGASGIDGRAAFATTTPFTVWGHGSFTSVDNDYVSGTTDSRYDGDVWGYNVGLDYKFADALIAGLSLGYNDTDLTTAFNNGSYQETGWVASPYVIYRPIANLTITGEAGYGMGDVDVTRDNNAVSGNTESDMWYAALTTSYRVRPIETLSAASLTPSLAFMAARKTVDGYTESDGTTNATTRSNTRQIKPAIEAAYDFAPTPSLTVTPFLETGLTYDFTDEINDDKTAFNLGGGVRLSDAITGLNAALEGSYLAGRADYTEYTIGGTITYGFAISDDQGRELGIITPFFTSNLNEYGNQRMRSGFGFDTGQFTSQLALSHMMSIANDNNDDTDSSAVEISMSMPF